MTSGTTNSRSRELITAGIAAALSVMVGILLNVFTDGWEARNSWWLFPGALISVLLLVWRGIQATDHDNAIETRRQFAALHSVAEEFPIENSPDLSASKRPSALLRAERAVVPYALQDELKEVITWLKELRGRTFFVLTGPALIGKTRLSVQLAVKAPADWRILRLKPGHADSAVDDILLVPGSHLVVVELDEFRDGIETFLDHVAADHSGRMRVLLIARTKHWLISRTGNSRQATRDAIAEAQHTKSGSMHPHGSEADLERWQKQAKEAFAKKLDYLIPLERSAPPPIGTPIGVIQAAALASLLSGTDVAKDLGAVLAKREMELWQAPEGGDAARELLRSCFAAAWLFDAQNPELLREAFERIPELSDASRERVSHLTNWLRRSYPGDHENLILYPLDTVSHSLVIPVVQADKEFLAALTTGLDVVRQSRVVAKLLGAAETFPDVVDLASGALNEVGNSLDAPQLREILRISPATRHTDQLLASMFRDCPPDLIAAKENLLQLQVIPGLENAQAALLEVILNLERSDASRADISARCHALAASLQDVGRRTEAQEYYREALRLLPSGTKGAPGPDDPLRASILIDFAMCDQEMGNFEEAAQGFERGVLLLRRRHEDSSAGHTVDLAVALGSHGSSLHLLGQNKEALRHHNEALALFRALPKDALISYDYAHGVVLSGVGGILRALGWYGKAMELFLESLKLLERAASTGVKQGVFELARAQGDLASCMYALGDPEDALPEYVSSLKLFTKLSMERPPLHKLYMASALGSYGNCLRAVNQVEEALQQYQNERTLLLELDAGDPDRFKNDLAANQLAIATCLQLLDKFPEALERFYKALDMFQKVRFIDATTYDLNVALAKGSIGGCLQMMNKDKEALAYLNTATISLRRLVRIEPARCTHDLVVTLANWGYSLLKLEYYEDALELYQEAQGLQERLAVTDKGGGRDMSTVDDVVEHLLRMKGRENEIILKNLMVNPRNYGDQS